MPQYELNLRDYWRVICKRRLIISMTSIGIFIPVFIYLQLQPRYYKAEAQVAVSQRKTGGDVLVEMFYNTPGDPMESHAKSITSQKVVILAALKLGLIASREQLTEEETKIVLKLQSAISTNIIKGTNRISIFVTDVNAVNAREYANAVAYSFVNYNLEEKTKEARTVRDSIEKQLKETE